MAVQWMPLDSTPGQRVFRRPLGNIETCFYWDDVFNGTAEIMKHVHLRTAEKNDRDIHSQSNVMRSWASVKRRFPLIAAEVEEHESGPRFILREEAITNLRPDDITFKDVDSFHDVECFIDDIMDGPRLLSSWLLARAYILRRTDKSDQFHIVILIAHCVTDATSTSTVLRTFLDTLSSQIEPPYIPLCERVHMFQPLENRLSYWSLPPAKRRWRQALGYAIHIVRISKFKGGHTLPGAFKKYTPYTPAKSRTCVSTFSRQVSSTILSNCRRHHITLNTAYYALSQVALARVLCRRYLRGRISEEEWEYRKRQPMHIMGFLNLRPYLDKDWFVTGGSGDVGFNVSVFQPTLPFMPLGEMSRSDVSRLELVDGAPDFPALMSFDRFLLRCANIKVQYNTMFKHPRFVEICAASHNWALAKRKIALKWLEMGDAIFSDDSSPSRPVQSLNPIITQCGSTLDGLHDTSRLSSTSRASFVALVQCAPSSSSRLSDVVSADRCSRGSERTAAPCRVLQLQYCVYYDERVFSQEIAKEWLHEVKDATLWYLGQSHDDKMPMQSKL